MAELAMAIVCTYFFAVGFCVSGIIDKHEFGRVVTVKKGGEVYESNQNE